MRSPSSTTTGAAAGTATFSDASPARPLRSTARTRASASQVFSMSSTVYERAFAAPGPLSGMFTPSPEDHGDARPPRAGTGSAPRRRPAAPARTTTARPSPRPHPGRCGRCAARRAQDPVGGRFGPGPRPVAVLPSCAHLVRAVGRELVKLHQLRVSRCRAVALPTRAAHSSRRPRLVPPRASPWRPRRRRTAPAAPLRRLRGSGSSGPPERRRCRCTVQRTRSASPVTAPVPLSSTCAERALIGLRLPPARCSPSARW